MNFINRFLFALLMFTFILISCQKESVTTNTNPLIPKIKTKTEAGATITYSYNNGKLSKINYTSSNYDTVYYIADSIIYYHVDSTGNTLRLNAYKLNAQGVAINANQNALTNETYKYNADGFMTNKNLISLLVASNDSMVINNNNVVQIHSSTNGFLGNTQNIKEFTFNDKINTLTNDAFGVQYLGKSSSNLILSEKSTFGTSACPLPTCTTPIIINYKYTYEYDSNNWVTKITKTNIADSSTTITTYTYY